MELCSFRSSALIITTGYGLEDRGVGSSPGRVKGFHFYISFKMALGPTQPPIQCVQLEYLDATVLRRGVEEIRVVVGRDPACWQRWRDVCTHWKQTNDLSQHPSTFRNGLGEPLRSFSWTVSYKYYNYTGVSFSWRKSGKGVKLTTRL
jgi:hypothetical protein